MAGEGGRGGGDPGLEMADVHIDPCTKCHFTGGTQGDWASDGGGSSPLLPSDYTPASTVSTCQETTHTQENYATNDSSDICQLIQECYLSERRKEED